MSGHKEGLELTAMKNEINHRRVEAGSVKKKSIFSPKSKFAHLVLSPIQNVQMNDN